MYAQYTPSAFCMQKNGAGLPAPLTVPYGYATTDTLGL